MELTKRGTSGLFCMELTKRERTSDCFVRNSRNVRTSGLFCMELTKREDLRIVLYGSRNVRTSGLFCMELTKREDLRIVLYGTHET
ncbi:hypothetical protein CEXT_33021 [Caerostris extrusa]|uniref:Uncharacterized protein n=1 Tax=Caerostris extrusa TaxID=172846 RepID=A0AAV4VVV9_CAEEX|nr:hypothetical protein CEXT_33021 [Caerostris extrusa]